MKDIKTLSSIPTVLHTYGKAGAKAKVILTFIAGAHGINFEHIPELCHNFGCFITLVLMGVIAVGSMIYASHKKWI